MPKIVINEYDNTTTGIREYSNFTVVVPGLIGTASGIDTSVFNEDGIYECDNQADFVKHVGKAKATEIAISKAKKPTLLSWSKYAEFSGALAMPTRVPEQAFKLAFADKNAVLCKAAQNSPAKTTFGLYFDENYTYTPVKQLTEYDGSTYYAVLDKNNVGADEKVAEHYGNQIAYELLGLGYTVLYKKFIAGTDDLGSSSFWEPLKDKATYDFRYVITGLITKNADANNQISKLCSYINGKDYLENGRGDAIALIDIDADAYLDTNGTPKTQAEAIKGIIKETANLSSADKFSALFAPTVTFEGSKDSVYDNKTFPASFYYLACAIESQATYPEWFAVAGYTRGRCNAFKIAETTVTLGEAAINALEPRSQKTYSDSSTVKTAVNVIAKIKGNYYLWGDRTAHPLGAEADDDLVASHFLNIRQLCTTIKKQLYINCRRFTFEPNSDVLWVKFCNAIEPTLDRMKANQGISDYQIIKKRNPKKAVLSAIIRIVPIEAVEDFEIDLTLEDSIEGDTIIIND